MEERKKPDEESVKKEGKNYMVFTNRIEFFNPGALPKPYEVLQKGDISLPRNPLVTKMFRVIDLAENAGYGFDKMIRGWLSHYSRKPVVSGDIDSYRIEFFFDDGTLTGTLTGTLKELLDYINKNQGIQAIQISKDLNKPIDTVKKQIKQLADKGLIERRGSKKTGGYYTVGKDREID